MRREILGLRRHKLQLLLLVEVVVVVVSVAVASTNSLVWAPKEAQVRSVPLFFRVYWVHEVFEDTALNCNGH